MRDNERAVMEQEQKLFLEELIKTEVLLMDFYEGLAERSSQDRDFWIKIASEEKLHAAIIKNTADVFVQDIEQSTINRELDRIREHNTQFQEQLAGLKGTELGREEAVQKAILFEKSTFELHYHKTLESVAADDMKESFDKLKTADKTHLTQLEEKLQEIKDARIKTD